MRIRNHPLRVETRIPAGMSNQFLAELTALLENPEMDSFKTQYLRKEIFSKYVGQETEAADVRRTRAIQKWLETEQRNERANPRIMLGHAHMPWVPRELWDNISVTSYEALRNEIRTLVARVLGPLEYPLVIQDGLHTNGASTRVRRSPSAALFKLLGEAHISQSALKHWFAAFSGTRLSNQTLTLAESSVLFTVPKKSDIDRVACKEPECNMLLQRSVGNHIRRRLLKFGIDLNDQTHNQRAAQTAVANDLATIDLSSASDSITWSLVMNLLPYDWYTLLDDLRVKSTLIDGQVHELQMFSSMGNGFTFELESLLFYAITRVVCRLSGVDGRVLVYGDDIIAPTRIVPRLSRVFHYFGFTMNPKKTHSSGLFRESCGRHYWNGFDVSPFYIRRDVLDLPDLINHLNHLLEWDGRGWGFFTHVECLEFWLKWISRVPRYLWGGIDPADNSALVTGHAPRRRLVRVTRRAPRPAKAGLDLWLLSRERNGPSSMDPLVIDPRFEAGFTAKPIVSRGERSSWAPCIAFCDAGPPT